MNSYQTIFRVVGLLVLIVVVGASGYLIGRSSDSTSLGIEEAQVSAASEQTVLYWQAPMNPSEIYDAPGKSAMGMDLIPVYDDENSQDSGSIISIDPMTVQNMGVRTEIVQVKSFGRTIRAVGEVNYDEDHLQIVNSKISGWIEAIHVTFVGEEIQEGAPLMDIYSPELVSTQEEFLLALRTREAIPPSAAASIRADADRLVSAARTRLEYWDIPEETISRLESTGEVRKTIRIVAPSSGVIIERNAIEGAFIKAGVDLFRIADLSSVWVHASFFDNEVPWISVGQPVEMELSYLPGKIYSGRVDFIYPFLREKARDVHVRLVFRNSGDYDLKPGMYANVELEGRSIPNAIVVPTEAIIRSGARAVAFVSLGDGKFEPREVEVGEVGGQDNHETRILSGLEGGEMIVTSAQFMLDSESRLQEAIKKMLAPQVGDDLPAAMVDPGGMQDAEMTDMPKADSAVDDGETDHSQMGHD
jgi:RND family efflux transporter MFP subunit